MKTLNQIKWQLIEFFENHSQINSVHYEDSFDFNAERNLSYPVCNIEYMESNVSGKKTSHTYKIILGDLVDANIKGHEDEIFSDAIQISEDFFAWAQNLEGWELEKTINIQKFADDASDRTAGIVFRFRLNVIRGQNECAIPTV